MSKVQQLRPKETPLPPVSRHENARLERFEAVAYHRHHAAAGPLLIELLQQLRGGADYVGHPQDDARLAQLHTRAVAAVSAVLADPGFSFSGLGWAMTAVNHEGLQALAEASGFDTLDHVAHALVKNPEELDARKFEFLSGQSKAKFLLSYCLNSERDFDLPAAFAAAPQSSLPLYLGLLAHRVNLHPRAHERREKLLGAHAAFADLKLPDGLLPPLADAYMYCSYGCDPRRHEAKATFSKLLEGMVRQHCRPPSAEELAERRRASKRLQENNQHLGRLKPVLLLPIEWLGSYHAMYRCYAPSIAQLRPYFRLVASCKESVLDEKARELFDDFLWLPEGSVVLSELVERINALAPDAVYYPSVGMALWWVALAQVRLAPVQLFTLGHPATTRSPAMDYVVAEEGQALPELFSERVLELPANAIQFTDRPDTGAALEGLRPAAGEENPAVLRVAVPSTVFKVTAPFLELLRRVQVRYKEWSEGQYPGGCGECGRSDEAPRLEFHFFPGVLGVTRLAAQRQLQRWLPGCIVHARQDYPGYMRALSQCHLHLSTFPFGGTNSLVDSMMLGIPIVCLEGREPHERFDGLMLRRVGLGALVAATPKDYEDYAVELLTQPSRRLRYALQLKERDARMEFCGPRSGPAAGAFGRAVRYAFERHEEIQASPERLVPWTDSSSSRSVSERPHLAGFTSIVLSDTGNAAYPQPRDPQPFATSNEPWKE